MADSEPMAPVAQEKGASWRHFAHDADIGIEGRGPTLAAAFEQAAYALMAIVTTATILPKLRVDVECKAPNDELLFVDWLNAIIFEMSVRNMLFGRFSATITGKKLTGALWGEPIDVQRHEPACEPKGATYTALHVGRDSSGLWSARCIVDV